ncbi:MAG: hypothetical protein ABRQ24_02525 [Syntrophomonadaceae bacterium]
MDGRALGFSEEKGFQNLLNNYAIDAVSLYGVISQDDFVALFNSQNKRQTDIDEVFPILLSNIRGMRVIVFGTNTLSILTSTKMILRECPRF